jgi:ferric-dicitrate binding protein FerR (iron transport regulator)
VKINFCLTALIANYLSLRYCWFKNFLFYLFVKQHYRIVYLNSNTQTKPRIAIMKERTDRITALLEKSLRRELTLEEKEELDLWLSEGIENRALYQQLSDEAQLLEKLRIHDRANSEAIWQKTKKRVGIGPTVVMMPKKSFAWIKYAAAAAVVVTVSAVAYFNMKKPVNESVVKTDEQVKEITVQPGEIVPGGQYAKLMLGDGSIIQLDKSPDGDLSKQNGLSLSKTNGHLIYSGRFITSGPVSTGAEKHASLHNMVSTPRGGQYQITLPDGSRVWLNAASSLRFPLAFAGNQRIVEVTGEAYFEVKKIFLPGSASQRMPFIVKITNPGAEYEVEVLGTVFNVKAYPEENEIRTSLLEGSVRIKEKGEIKNIEPGQQAIARNGELKVVNADVKDAAAWKDGWFPVNGSTQMVLNQVARWYNVEVIFEKNTEKYQNDIFDGTMPMSQTYPDMIKTLQSQNIHLKTENRKLIVIP